MCATPLLLLFNESIVHFWALWLCGCVALWLCGFVALRFYGFVATQSMYSHVRHVKQLESILKEKQL